MLYNQETPSMLTYPVKPIHYLNSFYPISYLAIILIPPVVRYVSPVEERINVSHTLGLKHIHQLKLL